MTESSLRSLPSAWMRVLNGRRSMLHYKPAALLVLLDMAAAGLLSDGSFELGELETRFEAKLKSFDPKGSRRGWEPFLHLGIGDQAWTLHKGEYPSEVPSFKPNRSRSFLLSYADRAVVDPQLLAFISTDAGRAAVRHSILELLRNDASVKSQALLEQEAPGFTQPLPPASALDFEIGQVYDRQRDIHGRFGGQDQGGISTPRDVPVVFLFTGESGTSYGYRDGWSTEGVFSYTGEGQRGDMQFVRGNRAIRDHVLDGKDLLLFEALGHSRGYRYLGLYECSSWESRPGPDVDGKDRKIIVFHLVKANDDLPRSGCNGSISPDNLEVLRSKALEAAKPVAAVGRTSSRATYRERSEIVKRYVLKRAGNKCEACDQPAPFSRLDGSPYLEAHHTRRLSDEGPDHPSSVGGICPTCHRRIHHGVDGVEWNKRLQEKIGRLEEELGRINPAVNQGMSMVSAAD